MRNAYDFDPISCVSILSSAELFVKKNIPSILRSMEVKVYGRVAKKVGILTDTDIIGMDYELLFEEIVSEIHWEKGFWTPWNKGGMFG